MDRRSLILGLGSLLAAPAIVRATSLMPVRGIIMPRPVKVLVDMITGHEAELSSSWTDERLADLTRFCAMTWPYYVIVERPWPYVRNNKACKDVRGDAHCLLNIEV